MIRRDASTKFGTGNKVGFSFFYSGLGNFRWRLFWRQEINFMKLRASYGTLEMTKYQIMVMWVYYLEKGLMFWRVLWLMVPKQVKLQPDLKWEEQEKMLDWT
jgi:hypothetical protein